jgi:chitinase
MVEGDTGTALMQVSVSLSQPSALPASVSYATADLTASAGSDYASSAGTLNFSPGQTAKLALVQINGDTNHEPNETFALTLSSPSGVTLGGSDGSETIVDNDPIAPAAPLVQAVGASALARVTWSLPANNGSPITAYQVLVYDNGVLQSSKSHTVTCVQPCNPARIWTVTGLANDKRYKFAVSAQNAKGSSPLATTTILVTNISNGGLLPGKPSAPHATAGAGRVTLTWVAPLNGTATTTSYTLTPYKNGVLQPEITVGQIGGTFVFTNVAAGATYTFTVVPISFFGPGPDSALSNPVKPT